VDVDSRAERELAVVRLGRIVAAGAVCAGLTWIGACQDGIVDTEVPAATDSTFVSDPVPLASGAFNAQRRSPSAAAATDVAFVALPPGTVPGGDVAIVRVRGAAGTLTTAMSAGGFDPVPVDAGPGDTVHVEVRVSGGAPVVFTRVVPAHRRPVVVRTNPPPRKRDVALNSGIVVVFNEPVDPATLSSSSVQLLRGSGAVAGAVTLLVGSSTAAVFAPDEPLTPNTDYTLVVTSAVRGLRGDALEADTSVEFATGTAIEGPVASVVVSPDSAEVFVGSQYQLSATALDAEGNVIIGRPTSWTVFDTTVATISATGLVTAVGEGIASIQAEIEGRFGFATLNVGAALAPVASVTVTPASGSVLVGRTLTLLGEARDSAGNVLGLRLITWTSSNPGVATVAPSAERGQAIVTGRAPGSAAIVAEVEGKRDTSFVTVVAAPPIVEFVISPDTLSLILHGTGRLTGVASAADGWTGTIDGAEIAWSTSVPAVASVSGGIVTAQQVGSTTITARWNGFTATADVRVVNLAFTDVRAALGRACGLTSTGAVYCWGTNWGAAGLGNGTTNDSPFPVAVAGGLTFTAISVGGYHTCGLASSGLLYCWGYNAHGQIGDGTNADRLTPVLAANGARFRAVTAGTTHTCAITVANVAYCWGQNWDGAIGGWLGDGTLTSSAVPVAVAGGLSFGMLSAGSARTCGIASSGAAYCWGAGALGNGSASGSTTPVPVSGGLVFVTVAAGEFMTCGVRADSTAYCWGANGYGQLGNGTFNDALVPVPVAGGLRFVALSTGGMSPSCAVASNGAAYCWGRNTEGELGDGTVIDRATPVAVVGGLPFANVTTGYAQSCGVTFGGVAYCWGNNYYGQLGNGSFVSSSIPVRVAGQP